MSVPTPFDPKIDSWSFNNWKEATDFSWDLMRRTYLAINPTQSLAEAPLDCLWYEIFKSCASKGNCGGMSMLGIALYKFGGFMGFCSPASFYTGPYGDVPHTGPDQADLHAALNIMQARQFSAAGIRNFLDVIKRGELNDGYAAFERVASGLASRDYAMISLSNGVFGDAAHTLIPYRATDLGAGTKVLHLWDPVRPYIGYPDFYENDHNRLVITGPTNWHYDQKYGTVTTGTTFDGSNLGWCFAIPTSLELHKGRQPMSVGFAITNLTALFVSGTGAAVTQIEDDEGRRLYIRDRVHRTYADFESAPARALKGVVRWPWYDADPGGSLPGDLYLIERPAGSSPLTVTVRGSNYRLIQVQAGNAIEIDAEAATPARDRVRVEDFSGANQAVELRTDSPLRNVSVRQLRVENELGHWRAIGVRNARLKKSRLRIGTSDGIGRVEVSAEKKRHSFHVELQRYRGERLASRDLGRHIVEPGESLAFRPRSWDAIADARVDRVRRAEPRPKRADRGPARG